MMPSYRYCVQVCGFTFVFDSVETVREYLAYYREKLITPVRGVEGDHWESQTRFQELPRYLHDEKRRPKVVAALTRALEAFSAMDPHAADQPSPLENHLQAVHARWTRQERDERMACWTTVDETRDGALTYHIRFGDRQFSFPSLTEVREFLGLLKEGYYLRSQSLGNWHYEISNTIAMPMTPYQRRLMWALERAIRQLSDDKEKKQEQP